MNDRYDHSAKGDTAWANDFQQLPWDEERFQRVKANLESHPWKFAKTMPTNPHFYTLREQWDDAEFVDAVLFIRECGYVHWFWRRPYIQLNVPPWFYWTMGYSVAPGETILINRKLMGT